jgi:hypothetical protein
MNNMEAGFTSGNTQMAALKRPPICGNVVQNYSRIFTIRRLSMWWLWFLVGFIVGCAATYVWFIIKLLNCKIKEGTPSASHNTGSPKCACPWIKPCNFHRDGGICGYSLPNQTGALRAGA